MGLWRATSVFSHPILYGVFCASLMSFYWYSNASLMTRIFKIGVVCFAAFFSLSAGPILSLIVQFGLIGLEVVSRPLKSRFAIIAGGVVSFLLFVQVAAESGVYRLIQVVSLSPGSAYYRTLIWEHGIDDVMRNPIFGMRPEDWTRLHWMTPSIDNHWLVQAMVGGIPSVIFLALALLGMGRRMFRPPTLVIGIELDRLRRGWAFSITAMLVVAATVFFFDKVQPLFGLLIGMGGAIAHLIVRAEAAAGEGADGGAAPRADPAPGTARRRSRAILG